MMRSGRRRERQGIELLAQGDAHLCSWTAALSLAGTVYSAYQSSKQQKQQAQSQREAQAAADPFAPQRPQYQTMLNNFMHGYSFDGSTGPTPDGMPPKSDGTMGGGHSFMTPMQFLTNPGSFVTDPSYQWRLNQGLEGVNRGMAASGMLNSGNRMLELMRYGQGAASQEYGNQFQRLQSEYGNQYSRLAQLAGVNIGSPGAASQAITIGTQNQITQQNANTADIGNSVQQIAKAVGGYFDPKPAPTASGGNSIPSGSIVVDLGTWR